MENVNFDETKQSQLPFVEMLINMGYRYISAEELNKERDGDTSKFILKNTAFKKLSEINSYEYKNETQKFPDSEILKVIDEIENLQFEGLIDTSRKIYETIMPTSGGKTIKVVHDGKTASENFRFIDFKNPENNDYAVAVEFEAMGRSGIRPDIVIFINGIPFSIIENKKSSVSIDEAISQHKRNQTPEYCPRLFTYPQLLVAANKEEVRYGTTGTPNKFYATWKEKGKEIGDIDQEVSNIISKEIDTDTHKTLLKDLNGTTYGHKQILDREVTNQDRSVLALFKKERLLDLTKHFIIYDAGAKKIMRYQQYFAIKKILKSLEEERETEKGTSREGGLIWHTQGSGKSLTMVMLVKALIEHPHISNPRILIVTDRKDLDRQIKTTFQNCGLKKDVVQAKSGSHLLKLIKDKDLRVVTTLVHKFESARSKKNSFEDLDKNIFVLIDEAHRSHGGMTSVEMGRIIPNACYVAFTGTPLLKGEKSKHRFGKTIDKYTIDDALEDGIILPLIYEGRFVDLKQDKAEIDKQVERITRDLSDKQKKHLQQLIEKKIIKDNPQRITEIAYDIEQHFLKEFKGSGLKGQIVAPSKFSAMLFQKYFESTGKINTALVVSDENGIIAEDDDHKKEVDDYLKNIKDNYQSLLSHEKEVIDSFKHNEDGVEILIVVDKLLTGFDAPKNTALYLAKELKDHNLLQAIARVNRLYENVPPKTAGFIIDYSENASSIKTAMQLFGNYDEEDVRGSLIDVSEKINNLETSYDGLHEMFKDLKSDDESYIQHLEDDPTRKQFYSKLNDFLRNFSECMTLQSFAHEFDHLDVYKREVKKFMELRKVASVRFADKVDFSQYKQALIKIMDNNITAAEAELLTKQIVISNKEELDAVIETLGSDKSKAEAIAMQVKKVITEKESTDPTFYKSFSEKIEELIQKMREKRIADIEALKQMKLLEDEVLNKKDESIPAIVRQKEGADIFYRNLQEDFKKYKITEVDFDEIIVELFELLEREAIVDWYKSFDVKREMKNKLDDYIYDEIIINRGIDIDNKDVDEIIEKVVKLAVENHSLF